MKVRCFKAMPLVWIVSDQRLTQLISDLWMESIYSNISTEEGWPVKHTQYVCVWEREERAKQKSLQMDTY